MKKAGIIVVSGLILIVAFALLIYPTPYKYFPFSSTGDGYSAVRVNIITGKTEQYMRAHGWVDTTKGVSVEDLNNNASN
ncbi:hypothetical protein [Paenibacillus sp. P3E]|uniref:hypothetical protein n=1 Tax=Paenibacillus sp. P3E TaxID=1349435 RepID=UPI000B34051F|nr:hypothetical protein [Paenibacillus sp. P3E]